MIDLSWDALMGQDAASEGNSTAANSNAPASSDGSSEGGGNTAAQEQGIASTKEAAKQEGGEGQAPAGGGLMSMLPILVIFVGLMLVMSFFGNRSQKKKQAQHDELYTGLKRDDRIVLVTGKYVVVDKVDNDRITVFADTARQVREVYHKNAVMKKEDGTDTAPDADSGANVSNA